MLPYLRKLRSLADDLGSRFAQYPPKFPTGFLVTVRYPVAKLFKLCKPILCLLRQLKIFHVASAIVLCACENRPRATVPGKVSALPPQAPARTPRSVRGARAPLSSRRPPLSF